MSKVRIQKDGLFHIKWDGERRKHIRRRVRGSNVLPRLRDACEIAEGVTLRDIFNIVRKNRCLKAILGPYSWCREIDEFHKQAEKEWVPEECDINEPLTSLEVFWDIHNNEFSDKKTKTISKDLAFGPGFHALGPPTEEHPAREDGFVHYGISMTPMYKLADLPVKLNTNFKIWSSDFKVKTPVFQSESVFTLLNVLDAIYWEISFNGPPDEAEQFREELAARMEDMKKFAIGVDGADVMRQLGIEVPEPDPNNPKPLKIVMHPDVARFLGADPDLLERVDPLSDDEDSEDGKAS